MNNILATIRTDKKDKQGRVPVYVYVYEGKRLVLKRSIGYKILPVHWNPTTRTVEGSPLAPLINSLILKTINNIQSKIILSKIAGANEDARTILRRDKLKDADFYSFAEDQIKKKNYAAETRRNYRVYLEKLKAFAPDLTIRKIDFTFLQSYEAYLRDELHNAHNTTASNMKFLNTIVNAARKAGIIEATPFSKYKRPGYKQTARVFLTAPELDKIEAAIPDMEEAVKAVALYFLFMARTGLRFSDAIRFRPEVHIVEGERIVVETQKTGKVTNIFINEGIRPLIDYVAGNRLYLTQVDFNRKLKIIAALAGVKKNITSHVARHSFGASLVSAGISIEVAKGLLSHGSTASTRVYFHLQQKDLDNAMKSLNKKSPG